LERPWVVFDQRTIELATEVQALLEQGKSLHLEAKEEASGDEHGQLQGSADMLNVDGQRRSSGPAASPSPHSTTNMIAPEQTDPSQESWGTLNSGEHVQDQSDADAVNIRSSDADGIGESAAKTPSTAVPTPTIWDTLNADNHRHWCGVALWLLAYDPLHALEFLRETHLEPYPPIIAVQDSLLHLSNLHSAGPIRKDNTRENDTQLRKLGKVTIELSQRSTGETLSLRYGTLAQILRACSTKQRHSLWVSLKKHNIDIHWHTYLHFATHLARDGYFEQGLEAILEAHKKGAQLDHYAFLSTCATLLRSTMRQPSGLRVCLDIVDTLVGMGVKLNLELCNVIMLNAVEAYDFNTAWSIYHSLEKYGLAADAYTFAVLLKACKINLDDAEMLNETIRSAITHVDVKTHAILAAEILHTLALHHTKHHPKKAFETLAEAYSQLFDTAPLAQLGMLPQREPSPHDEQKMPPSHSAIGIMLTTYLHQLFLQTQSPVQTRALYHRFRGLVNSGTEPFASMVDKDYMHNAFLATLIKTKAGLLPAAEVVKDMQRSHPADRQVKQCEPSVQTWTIFMHGFQRHGQMKMAEQVLLYMRRMGKEPDLVVWNVLAQGYALLQDVKGVKGSLRRLGDRGFEWDGFTRSAVRRLSGGKGEMVFREVEGKEVDFTRELQEDIGRRIEEREDGKYVPMARLTTPK
jgi:pentatricopeptide repeat protein